MAVAAIREVWDLAGHKHCAYDIDLDAISDLPLHKPIEAQLCLQL